MSTPNKSDGLAKSIFELTERRVDPLSYGQIADVIIARHFADYTALEAENARLREAVNLHTEVVIDTLRQGQPGMPGLPLEWRDFFLRQATQLRAALGPKGG